LNLANLGFLKTELINFFKLCITKPKPVKQIIPEEIKESIKILNEKYLEDEFPDYLKSIFINLYGLNIE